MLGVGREVAALILKEIGFKGYRAIVEVGVILQHASAIDKHRVGLIGMTLYEPGGHIRCHLHTIQNTLYVKRSLIQDLCGTADSLLPHGLTRLIEQETQSHDKYDSSKQHHPQADPDGEFSTNILEDFFHNLLP